MPLKFKRETLIVVDYGDLENFIDEVYDHDFELVADQELSNDVDKKMNIHPEELDEYDQAKLDKFVCGQNPSYMLRILMTDMCNRGLIEAGTYLIEISW